MQNKLKKSLPYLGLSSFQDAKKDRLLFFGRDRAKHELLDRVLAEDITLLFARSGLGKTSLINAGLVEVLRERDYYPVVCRVTYSGDDGPVKSLFNCIENDAKKHKIMLQGERNKNTLWDYFASTTFSKNERLLQPVLIFDQFEELFTLVQAHQEHGDKWLKEFIHQLADVVRHRLPENLRSKYLEELEQLPLKDNRRKQLVSLVYEGAGPDIKVLLSIREDFLPELELLKEHIPGIFKNVLRLLPLTNEQARDAIIMPSQQKEILGDNIFDFESEAVNEIVKFLSTSSRTGIVMTGAMIEPTQLQVLCEYLNKIRVKKRSDHICKADLGGTRGMKNIIRLSYSHTLQEFSRIRFGWNAQKIRPSFNNFILINRPRAAIKKLCEKGLITPQGFRNSLIDDVVNLNYGVTNKDLNRLVNLRLLRKDPRLESVFYELSHDTLVDAIKTTRKKRRLMRVVIVVVILFVPAVINMFFNTLPEKYAAHQLVQELKEANRIIERKNNKKFSTLSQQSSINLKSKSTEAAKTAKATKVRERTDAILDLIRLGNTDFSSMNLSSVDISYRSLSGVDLSRSNLSDSNLSSVDFRGSDLSNANLMNADLTAADMSGANIKNTKFEGSNWWLAFGFSPEQVKQLKELWPQQQISVSDRYLNKVYSFQYEIKFSGKDKEKLVMLYNRLAWHRAIHGVDLSQALENVDNALKIVDKKNLLYPHALDTRGLILLQWPRTRDIEALENLKEAVKLGELGENSYHLAIAYERTGNQEQAEIYFHKSKELKYRPSYELLLTPRYKPMKEARAVKTESTDVPGMVQ